MACKVTFDTGCEIDFSDMLNLDDVKAPELKSSDELIAKSEELKEKNIKVLTDVLTEQWKNQRLSAGDYAKTISSLLPSVLQGSTQELLAIEDTKLKQYELSLKARDEKFKLAKTMLDLKLAMAKLEESKNQNDLIKSKIDESKARVEEIKARQKLQKAQEKAFNDDVKFNTVKLIFNAWSTMFTRNQAEGAPDFLKNAKLTDTVVKWFEHIGMDNPNLAKDTDTVNTEDKYTEPPADNG